MAECVAVKSKTKKKSKVKEKKKDEEAVHDNHAISGEAEKTTQDLLSDDLISDSGKKHAQNNISTADILMEQGSDEDHSEEKGLSDVAIVSSICDNLQEENDEPIATTSNDGLEHDTEGDINHKSSSPEEIAVKIDQSKSAEAKGETKVKFDQSELGEVEGPIKEALCITEEKVKKLFRHDSTQADTHNADPLVENEENIIPEQTDSTNNQHTDLVVSLSGQPEVTLGSSDLTELDDDLPVTVVATDDNVNTDTDVVINDDPEVTVEPAGVTQGDVEVTESEVTVKVTEDSQSMSDVNDNPPDTTENEDVHISPTTVSSQDSFFTASDEDDKTDRSTSQPPSDAAPLPAPLYPPLAPLTQDASSRGETSADSTSNYEDSLTDRMLFSIPSASVSETLHRLDQQSWISDLTAGKVREVMKPKVHDVMKTEVQEGIKPFTDHQLHSLYYNPQLEHNEEFIDNFLKTIHEDKHEFYEIVLNYYRSRNHLASAEHDIHVLQTDYEKTKDRVWRASDEIVTVQGHCQDKAKVTMEHQYHKAVYDEGACQDTSRLLKDIRAHIHEQLSLYAYEAQLSRLQVESYLYRLYASCPGLQNIPHNAPVTAMVERDADISQQVAALRTCITVLFMFQRKPVKDEVFKTDTRNWLKNLVGTLLRVATLDDHLYILNQVLRCPAGVGHWAAQLVQPVSLSTHHSDTWGGPMLDHTINMLATLLIPVRARQDLLAQLKVAINQNMEKDGDNKWILVDSDGEEDDDPLTSWQALQENDVVALLGQLGLDNVIRHVMFIKRDYSRDKDDYDVTLSSEACMLKLFAFFSCFISIYQEGLVTFSVSRYRQLNKRLGRNVRQLVHYLSEHWTNFQTANQQLLSASTLQRLQVEFDAVFLRAVVCLLSAQRLGAWQFLADIPYSQLSSGMMWRLVWGMHQGCQDIKQIRADLPVTECKNMLFDGDNKMWFEDKLTSLPTSEATYLLTTFANMARARPSHETEFIEAITGEVYEIAYMCAHTREFCSKPGRELLASICQRHTYVISSLLIRVARSMDKIGLVSQYLFKGLPLHVWRPTEPDISCLHGWLLQRPLASPEHHLARLVFLNLNWGSDPQSDQLFLDRELQRGLAITIVEVYTMNLAGKTVGSLFTEGLRQMASLVRSQQSEEQQLASWAWATILKLHLHGNQQPRAALSSPRVETPHSPVPDLSSDPRLLPVKHALRDNFAIASYTCLMMMSHGHSIADFCETGVAELSSLVMKSHVIPAVRVLACVLPIFIGHVDYLITNNSFLETLSQLFSGDQSKTGLIFCEFPGPATKLFAGMMLTQVMKSFVPGGPAATTVIKFWLLLLTKLPRWQHDRNIHYILDQLVKVSYRTSAGREVISPFLYELYETQLSADRQQGVLASLTSWLSASNQHPTLLGVSTLPQFAWLAAACLQSEAQWEEDSRIWPLLRQSLHSAPTQNLDQALKKVCTDLGIESCPSVQHLSIYRWGTQAMEMPVTHPLLPIIWQKFFLLYLGRHTSQSGLSERSGVGELFFSSAVNVSMMKKMKKKLLESADAQHKKKTDLEMSKRQRHRSNQSADTQDEEVEILYEDASSDDETLLDSDSHTSILLCDKLLRLYQTFSLWLDEPRLHDPSLYLPALPPLYQPERLASVLQNQTEPWLDCVDFQATDEQLTELTNDWATQESHDSSHGNWISPPMMHEENLTAAERILSRLKRHCRPVAPPSLVTVKCAVPEISTTLLTDKHSLLFALRSDYSALVNHANLYSQRQSQHVAMDHAFTELLPSWYTNETVEVTLSQQCRSSFNPTHRCKGAAVTTAMVDEMTRNDITNRKIDENRAEYKQLMIESVLPPPQNVCSSAVHVENTITSLIRLYQTCCTQSSSTTPTGTGSSITSPGATTADRLQYVSAAVVKDVGTALFYHTATYINESVNYYPPTRQFFSSCIEVLGQEFIRGNPGQSQPLLQAILQTPSLISELSPNFSPNASPELFITMYEDMLAVPANQGPDIAFALLTKFDVELWLSCGPPAVSQRAALIEAISHALRWCGRETPQHFLMVFEIYRAHLKQMLLFQFPDHYGQILKLILTGSSHKEINTCIWEDLFLSLGCPLPSHNEKNMTAAQSPEQSSAEKPPQYTQHQVNMALSSRNMADTVEWMASYFFRQRVGSPDTISFGLYHTWQPYLRLLSKFLVFLIQEAVKGAVNQNMQRITDPERIVQDLWQQLVSLFVPWIQPLDNADQLILPWTLSDAANGSLMVRGFVQGVSAIYTAFEGAVPLFSQNALSLLWPYYVENVARKGQVPKYILKTFHCEMKQLPWKQFFPDIQAVDLMMKITENGPVESRHFVGHMVGVIQWRPLLEGYCRHEPTDIVMTLHICLFTLLVKLSQVENVMQDTSLLTAVTEAETFDWHFLDARTYISVTEWLITHADPKCVVAERTMPAARVLSFLRRAAGFSVDDQSVSHPETPVKRVAFLHVLVQLISKCSHLTVPTEPLCTVIMNMLTETETIVGSIVDMSSQQQQALSLCTEILSVLNHCNPQGGHSEALVTTMLEWISSSSPSPLLLPLVTASCRSLASVSNMVRVIEGCCDAYFMANIVSDESAGWSRLLTVLSVPELSHSLFLEEGVRQGGYLTLYAYELQHLPLSQSLTEEEAHVTRLITQHGAAKPSQDNEDKLILWWVKICELLLRQLDFGGNVRIVSKLLLTWLPSLVKLGEDKSSLGLMGAIGLGKRSQLSPRFRIIARMLSVYLAAQVPNNNSLRVTSDSLGSLLPPGERQTAGQSVAPSQQAVQALSQLDAARSNKNYAGFNPQIQFAISYACDSNHTIHHVIPFLTQLARELFPDKQYLAILQLPAPSSQSATTQPQHSHPGKT